MSTGAVNGNSSTSGSSSTQTGTTGSVNDALEGLDLSQFLNLMITQLQNQDPLNPTDSGAILQQIGELRSISATDQMTKTLSAMQLGQNLTNASALIGKNITGLDDSAKAVNGVVDKVTITDGVPKLDVAGQTVSMNNVATILPSASEASLLASLLGQGSDQTGSGTAGGGTTTGDTSTDGTTTDGTTTDGTTSGT